MRDEICKLCEIGQKSYYVWKNKNHIKLIKLLEKYFTKEDLEEFLASGKISALEEFKLFQETKENNSEYKAFLEFKEFQEFRNKMIK